MKTKMDEIDEIWVIYRINLGQNSRWNINLLLKINFSRWIKNWEQSGRWINTGVIWAVKSCCMKEGKYHQKISDISPIYHRYITNFLPPDAIFWKISDISPWTDISAIFWRYLWKYLLSDFSPWNIVSTPPDTRYIGDISPIYPDIFLHGYKGWGWDFWMNFKMLFFST